MPLPTIAPTASPTTRSGSPSTAPACQLQRAGSKASSRALWALMLCGCSVEIASDVTEQSAQQIRTALSAHSVPSDRIAQAASDSRFSIRVPRQDEAYAAAILARNQLPRTASQGLASLMKEGSLIPSRNEQHLRWLLGTAAELEQTLGQHPNVLTARVHLAAAKAGLVPPSAGVHAPSASVFLSVSAAQSPLEVREVQRLVSGAILGLTPDRVTVVASTAPELPERNSKELVRWGPITTTRGSLTAIQWVFSLVITLNLCMTALVLVLWKRTARDKRLPQSH